jgi:ligand-binding sensor domain-containing protein
MAGRGAFTLYTTYEGLADNMILCMMQDKDGFIWFGTDNGVSRYDPAIRNDPSQQEAGKPVFTNFTTADGLCGPSVNSITQDARGRIWFGTRGGSTGDACYYDGKIFTLVTNMLGMRFSNVRMIVEDKNGIIWIGGQDGLYRYDPSASAKSTSQLMINITKDFIGYIYEDKAGNLWLSQGSADGMSLKRFDGKVADQIATHGQVFGIIEDARGNIWFGTPGGIVRYNGKEFEDFLD